MHQLSPMGPTMEFTETSRTHTPSWDGIPVVDVESHGFLAPLVGLLQRQAAFVVVFSISIIQVGVGWMAYRLFHLLSPDVQRAFIASSDVRWTLIVGAAWVLGLAHNCFDLRTPHDQRTGDRADFRPCTSLRISGQAATWRFPSFRRAQPAKSAG